MSIGRIQLTCFSVRFNFLRRRYNVLYIFTRCIHAIWIMESLQSADYLQETLFTVAQPLVVHDAKNHQQISANSWWKEATKDLSEWSRIWLPRFKVGEMRIKFCCNALPVITMTLGLKVCLTDADGKIIRRWQAMWNGRGGMAQMGSEVGVMMATLEASVDCHRPFDGNIRQEWRLPEAILCLSWELCSAGKVIQLLLWLGIELSSALQMKLQQNCLKIWN